MFKYVYFAVAKRKSTGIDYARSTEKKRMATFPISMRIPMRSSRLSAGPSLNSSILDVLIE